MLDPRGDTCMVLAVEVKKVLGSEFSSSLLAMFLCTKSSILYSGIPCSEQPWNKLPDVKLFFP